MKLAGNIVAVVVMLVIAAAVGLRLWANEQRLEVPMLWNGIHAANDRVAIVVGNDLYLETMDGENAQVLPLAQLGIRDFNGDMLALPNGDVILAAGQLEEMDFEEKLRKTRREARGPDDPKDFLQRCSLETRHCELLNGDDSSVPVFRPGRAFDISQGPGNTLLAADISGHRVHLLAPDGRILDTIDSGLEFPNALHLVAPDEAMVVDTNHHRLAYFSIDESGFGELRREVSILDWPGVDELQRFPFAWARTADGSEWLLVADYNMGNAILLRDHEGERQEIELPGPVDPADFITLPDSLLVLDQGTDRVLAFSHAGVPQRNFGSVELQQRLAANAEARSRYSRMMTASLNVLLAILVLGVPAALIYLRKRYKVEEKENAESIELQEGSPEGVQTEGSISVADPAHMLDKLRGIYHFNRTHGFIDPDEKWRLVFLVTLLVASIVVSQFFLLVGSPEEVYEAMTNIDPTSAGLFVLGVVATILIVLFMKLEELRIDRDGVTYTSPLPGFLKQLHPDWQLAWREIRDVRLTYFRSPKNPQMWRLVFVTMHGEEKSLVPLQWGMSGAREPGFRLMELTRLTEGLVRRTIIRRMLFRILATQMKRLREQRAGA